MKWRLMTIIAALCMLIPAFTSCDKDDKDEPAVVDGIAGLYEGSLKYSVMGYPPGDLDGTYTVEIFKSVANKGAAIVMLPKCSFTYPGSTAGAYTIPGLHVTVTDVTEKENVYTINVDEFEESVTIGDETVKYTGKLTGTIAGKDVKLEYTVRPGRMPMDINFTFQGTIK